MKAARFIFAGIIAVISSPLLYGIVAEPVLSTSAGSLDAAFSLTVTCSTPGAIIHDTHNGAEPTLFEPTYATPLTINRTWTVKAKAWAGAETSNTVTGDFQVSGAILAGQAHSLALKGHGPVVAWGLQDFGRLESGKVCIAWARSSSKLEAALQTFNKLTLHGSINIGEHPFRVLQSEAGVAVPEPGATGMFSCRFQ